MIKVLCKNLAHSSCRPLTITKDLIAISSYLPPSSFSHDLSKTHPKYLNSDTYSNRILRTRTSHFRPSSPLITIALLLSLTHIKEARYFILSPFFQKSPFHHQHPIFITASIYSWKSQGNMMQPCLTPLSILKQSLSPNFTLTRTRLLTYILLIPLDRLAPTS